jgi:hypothetical protein
MQVSLTFGLLFIKFLLPVVPALSNVIVRNVEFLTWNVVTVQRKPEADALIE